MLRPHIIGDDEARERLAREVSSLRRITSPRIAEVLDADPHGPTPYVATRYVPGLSLHEHVREEGPIEGADLLHFAHALAEALIAVHAVGVLHRDIKPSNVLMEGRTPVLIDFGLARLADDPRLTHTGWLLGTPGYLAPEILYGDEATPASDVHAWAATVVYAATGRPPYGKGPAMAIMDRVRRGDHELSAVPEQVVGLLRACLAPEPLERPGIHEIHTWLRQQLDLATVPTPVQPVPDQWTMPVAAMHREPPTDGALLRACGVLVVAARVVEPVSDRQQLTGVQGLLDEACVVGSAHHLDAVGARDPGPVADVLADVRVREPSLVQHLVDVGHRSRVLQSVMHVALKGTPQRPFVESPARSLSARWAHRGRCASTLGDIEGWRWLRPGQLGTEADRTTFRTLHTASLAAPALRSGLTRASAERSVRYLRVLLGAPSTVLTDNESVLAWDGHYEHHADQAAKLAVEATGKGATAVHDKRDLPCDHPSCDVRTAVVCPLTVEDTILGTLQVYVPHASAALVRATEEVAAWVSSHLELAELDAHAPG